MYNFHDYKGSSKILPEDVNSEPFKTSDMLDPTGEFTALLKRVQEKKLFGTGEFVNPKTGHIAATFEFHGGVCKLYTLIEYAGKSQSSFQRTIINSKVNFKRDNIQTNSHRSK